MAKRRGWPRYFLIAISILLGLAVIFNAFNIQLWPFNPPDVQTKIPLTIVYPPTASTTSNSAGDLNSLSFNGILLIDVGLNSTGPIVENKSVTIHADGVVSPKYADKITKIHVAMEDALLCGGGCGGYFFSLSAPNFGVTLQSSIPAVNPFAVPPVGNLASFTQLGGRPEMIFWSVQGDYYPIITIFFNNGSQKSVPYPNLLVHVEPASALVQERDSRINTAVSLALVFFGFVEIWRIIKETK